MAWSREGLLPMLGLGAALALGGCVDMIYDSGSMIEDLLAVMPDYFYDGRSDDKGPEPEDLAFGRVERPSLPLRRSRACQRGDGIRCERA